MPVCRDENVCYLTKEDEDKLGMKDNSDSDADSDSESDEEDYDGYDGKDDDEDEEEWEDDDEDEEEWENNDEDEEEWDGEDEVGDGSTWEDDGEWEVDKDEDNMFSDDEVPVDPALNDLTDIFNDMAIKRNGVQVLYTRRGTPYAYIHPEHGNIITF